MLQQTDTYKEILATGSLLFQTNGYESTSVQQIIDQVGIAKGTFYHYFKSKGELLNALIEQMTETITAVMDQISREEGLGATEKLNKIFQTAGHIKMADTNIELIIASLRSMMRIENIIMREKLLDEVHKLTTPILARIIRQGVAEGIYDTDNPELAADVIMKLGVGVNKTFQQLAGSESYSDILKGMGSMRELTIFYQESIARILGTEKETIKLTDEKLYDIFEQKLREKENEND